MKPVLVIIDGSSYFFRAYFAIQRLSNSKGFPTNAIYGFINMLLKVLDVDKPQHLVIAFDTPKPTFRKLLYKEYKANREAPPEDLVKQIPHILRAVDAFGIKRLQEEGAEADDVIATLARKAVHQGYRVDIITGDKDLMQLVTPEITLYDTMKDKRVDPLGVVERFGVKPEQVVDFLALMGDASDNIPGVTGIGEKTAAELICKFGSLDGIYSRLDEIKQEKRRETLKKEKEMAYLSQKLATVKDDLELDYQWSDFDYQGPDPQKLKPLFEEFEFQGLMRRFELKREESQYKKGSYQTVLDEENLKKISEGCKTASWLSVDTETTSLTIHDAKVVGISLSWEEGIAYYIPLGHAEPGQLSIETVWKILKPIFEDSKIPKVGQNLKYDYQIFKRWGITLSGIQADTLIESYLIETDQPHNLDSLALRHLEHQNISYESLTGTGKKQINFSEVPIDKATEYSGEDADVALRIHHKLYPRLKEMELKNLFEKVEIPLVTVLAEMEYEGVRVDGHLLKEMEKDLSADQAAVEDKVYELAGGAFNINSPKQLSHVLFEKLKLPVVRKTKTGLSTDESVLQELSSAHPIGEWILRYRELGKLKSTYVDGLIQQIHPETGRVHTSYNQTVTATGRLSSSNPNLQNIPTTNNPRHDIRAVFVPAPGHELFAADYSQVELRLLADMSEDAELLRAFSQDEDVHSFTARLIFGVKEVTAEHRKIAKTINFGVVYGQTPYGLSQLLKISPGEAKAFIDKYFMRYSGIKKFMHSILEGAREKGYVTTQMGRRRYLPEISSQNKMRREMAERAAINTPLQGTAADMIKVAMVSIHDKLKSGHFSSKMIMQVHDELVFEVPVAEKADLEKMVLNEMENAMKLKIPLKVDSGWGKNWRECS